MSSSSLSSVVSTLVRASMGSSVPNTVTDEELDRHVAELILKEAKQKAELYLKDGVRAYLPDKEPDANLPRANKRFLSTIIRNTDEHNRAILKAQAEAAQEVKAEREEQEKKERRARALEATEAERMRRLMGGPSRRRNMSWDRRRDSRRRRRSRDSRVDGDARYSDEEYDRRKRKRRSRSRSPVRKDGNSDRHRRQSRRDEEDREEGSSRKHRRRSRSQTPEDELYKSNRKHERSRKTRRRDELLEDSVRRKGKGKDVDEAPVTSSSSSRTPAAGTSRAATASEASDEEAKDASSFPAKRSHRSQSPPMRASPADLSSQFKSRKSNRASPPPPASPTLSEEEDIERFRPRRRRRPSPDPHEPQGDTHSLNPDSLPSKMDKYFEESYDPRLDTGPLTLPTVPSTGFIDGTEFERWEAMLDVIRQRREDKAERKRLERLGLLPDRKSKEKETKTLKPSEAWTMDSGTSALDIKYSKRGAVREWDLGKGSL